MQEYPHKLLQSCHVGGEETRAVMFDLASCLLEAGKELVRI